jgi:hypothetical protein
MPIFFMEVCLGFHAAKRTRIFSKIHAKSQSEEEEMEVQASRSKAASVPLSAAIPATAGDFRSNRG